MANILKEQMSYSNQIVFNALLGPAFVDLDLSSFVGVKRAFCFLKVKANGGGANYYSKTKGDAENVGAPGGEESGSSVTTLQDGNIGYIAIMTDGSGVIQHRMTSGATSLTITLVSYANVK